MGFANVSKLRGRINTLGERKVWSVREEIGELNLIGTVVKCWVWFKISHLNTRLEWGCVWHETAIVQ